MKKTLLSTLLSGIVATMSFGQCNDVFFSEYIEGSSFNKAIEIYNPSSSPIDLSSYEVHRFNNGSTSSTSTFTFPGTLGAGDVYVIVNGSASAGLASLADTLHSITGFNGDDVLLLINTATNDTIDAIGELGVDPGSSWTVGTGATANSTLIRNIGIQQGNTDWGTGINEWTALPIDTYDSLGMHTMTSCVYTPSFGPCGDLFFSEYIEGSSSNKALEIYNPTPADLDLSNYVIYRNNNGSLVPTDSLFPAGTITAGGTYIIGNPGAIAGITGISDTTHSMTFYNGDDAVWLKNIVTGDTLDIIGEIGVDPGSGWTVGSGATNNFTLVRNVNINQGQLDWTLSVNEWTVFPMDMVDSLGGHTMTPCGAACTPVTFNFTWSSCTGNVTSPSGTYTWNTTGIYNDTIFNAAGCDSIYVVDLTVSSQTTSSITVTGCNAYASPSGLYTWTTSGTYTDTLTNAAGCDSIITVNLTIDPNDPTLCAGNCTDLFFSEYIEGSSSNKALEIYNPTSIAIDLTDYVVKRHTNGATTASGTYNMNGMLAPGDVYVIGNDGADAAVLAVADTTNGATWFNGDDAMTLEKVSTGDTIDVIGVVGIDPGVNWPAGNGATSEFTLVRNAAIQKGNTVWTPSEWIALPQNTFDSLGMHTAVACAGCTPTTSSIVEIVCDSYTSPAGNVYTSTGTYTDTLVNAAGCDSIISIDLTINTVDTAVTLTGGVLSAVGTATGTYQWIDCSDNSPVSGATSFEFTPTTTGDYACIITHNGCTDTTACTNVQVSGITENTFGAGLSISPNPTTGKLNIDLGSTYETLNVEIINLLGQTINTMVAKQANHVECTIDGEQGYYFVRVTSSSGASAMFKVLKK